MYKKPPQLLGQTKRSATKIRPKAAKGGIYGRFLVFSNFDKCRLEVARDVISDVAIGLGRHGCLCEIE